MYPVVLMILAEIQKPQPMQEPNWADEWQAWGAIAQVVLAVVSLFIAWLAFSESRRAAMDSIRPELVIADIACQHDEENEVYIIIKSVENLGTGLALNVRVDFEDQKSPTHDEPVIVKENQAFEFVRRVTYYVDKPRIA